LVVVVVVAVVRFFSHFVAHSHHHELAHKRDDQNFYKLYRRKLHTNFTRYHHSGYAPDGLPLYNFQAAQARSASILSAARSFMRSVLDNRDSKQIFIFLCLNFAFMLVEFA
jgi:hypothetical protein